MLNSRRPAGVLAGVQVQVDHPQQMKIRVQRNYPVRLQHPLRLQHPVRL
jgi:hypothetical protein